MGKVIGFCFFLAGLAAVYVWGVQPLLRASSVAPGAPIVVVTHAPSTAVPSAPDQQAVARVASQYLSDWQRRQYSAMYDLLAASAQARISRQAFVNRYTGVLAEATVQSISSVLGAVQAQGPQASAAFSDVLQTSAVGTIRQDNAMQLLYVHGRWGIDWYPAVIFKQLEDPYVVHLVTTRAQRGAILDRHGIPLAEDGQLQEIGVVPGQINDEALLLKYLSHWLHMTPTAIKHLYTLPWAQPDYFMPIATITQAQFDAAPRGLLGVEADGVTHEASPGRIYPQGSVASILVGYVNPNTGHGVAGLEQSLDSVLTGKNGAELDVMNRAYTMVDATIASVPAVNGHDVRLTIDLKTQKAAEHTLGGRNGAAVAIDPSNGQVLALVSSPGYDPNSYEVGTPSPVCQLPHCSQFSRATLGTYPIGSIFKIVSMAAAMQRGGYTASSMINGPGVWYGLGANDPLHDWLPSGHGTISLQEALTQSCDTCFYQVAQHLDSIDQNILPQFARAFGFGSPTGIDQVSEAPGLVGDNAWKEKVYHDAWRTGDTVNLSIGQGFFLATPLQTATMLAAVADGGTRHVPELILSVAGEPSASDRPMVAGHLPVAAAQLHAIIQGMIGVTTESTGTATFKFQNFQWVVAGKTGTAQNPGGQPHAWFGAFAPATHPRIALAVVVENGGEGSYVAAPVARAILQAFLSEATAPAVSGPQALSVPSH
jgi:penicillin-binding protein 2